MAASVLYRQMEIDEKDHDMALFFGMHRGEMEETDLLNNSGDFYDQIGREPDSSIPEITSYLPDGKMGDDEFLNFENDKTDYDWLLSPPETPYPQSLEMETKKTLTAEAEAVNPCPAASEPKSANPPEEPASPNNFKQAVLSTSSNSSRAANARPSSTTSRVTTTTGQHRKPATTTKPSRSSTPTSRATMPATTKPSRSSTPTSRPTLPATTTKPSRSSTPNSRALLPATTKPSRSSTPTSRATPSATTKPSRSSTPTSRATISETVKPSKSSPSTTSQTTLPSSKPTGPSIRSSTPTRPMVRSSTPTSRTSTGSLLLPSKPVPRSVTPTGRPSNQAGLSNSPGPVGRASSVTKSGPKTVKNPAPSRGTSPTVKSRPWASSERPSSTSRPGAPNNRSNSTENGSNGKSSWPSCHSSNGSSRNGSSLFAGGRAVSTASDDVNPVLIGTKMVERVVNMRKLAPPKEDDIYKSSNTSGKSLSSQENSGFGRSLSKKSLDMALRHMDITRSIQGNLRPLVTSVPASSVYSVRSGSTKSKTRSALDSPLATSSNTSSEPSVNYTSHYLDGSEVEDNDPLRDRPSFRELRS